MAQQRIRRERPILDTLTNDAFRRLGGKHYNADGSVYFPHDAAWDTARSVEDPIQTNANIQKENPFPPQFMDYYANHNDARTWDEFAQHAIREFIITEMDHSTGARRQLYDQRYDESDRQNGQGNERE